MITIRKSAGNGLEAINEIVYGSWVNVIDPTADEIDHLHQALGVLPDFVAHSLDIDERARTEKENEATLIILRVPFFQGHTAGVPYTTVPLGVIITDKLIVTVCKVETGIAQGLLNGQARGISTTKRHRFVLELFRRMADDYLNTVRTINKAVDALEDRLQRSLRNKEVLELLKYQKSLVYFTTGLKSNELLMERLQKARFFEAYPDDEDLLDEVLIEIRQAIEMTEISNNILSQMMDAFASIISNNLNVVMKFLASVTIILSLPTLVASIYGMNVNLPFDESPQAFAVILAGSLTLSLVVVFIFWKRDWL